MSKLILSSSPNIRYFSNIVNDFYLRSTEGYRFVLDFVNSSYTKIATYKGFLGNYSIKLYNIPVSCKINSMPKEVLENLYKHKVVILMNGGNTYYISMELHRNGWFNLIKELVEKYDAVYFGYSAGAIIATQDVNTAQWADIAPKGFKKEEMQGLGFVDFLIKPHYGYHYHSLYDTFALYSKKQQKDFYLIEEHGAVIVDDRRIFKIATDIISPSTFDERYSFMV